MKKLLCAAVLCLGGITTPSASQATDQVKISPYELMISLGAVAYVFDVDASLKGAPRTSLEARRERFLVEPGKVVLAFPKNSAYIDGIQHSAILTEDGQWGMVPMRAAGGFSYFLNEATIEQVYDAYKASGAISWVVVTSGFASPDPRIHFSRGEIFQIDTTFESGQPAAIINSSVSFMKTKAREISSLSPQSSQVSSQDGNLFVRLSGTQLGHVEYIGSQVIDFMKAKEEAQGGAWDLFRDHFVELWPKVVKLHAPLRVDCNMTVELKKQKSAEASEKLKASFDSESVIPALKAIGIGISPDISHTV